MKRTSLSQRTQNMKRIQREDAEVKTIVRMLGELKPIIAFEPLGYQETLDHLIKLLSLALRLAKSLNQLNAYKPRSEEITNMLQELTACIISNLEIVLEQSKENYEIIKELGEIE